MSPLRTTPSPAVLLHAALQEGGFLPPLRPRGGALTREQAGVLWDRLVACQHALIDLTERPDPDVRRAESLVHAGRAAGLPEFFGWTPDRTDAQNTQDTRCGAWSDRRTVAELTLNEQRREASAVTSACARNQEPGGGAVCGSR